MRLVDLVSQYLGRITGEQDQKAHGNSNGNSASGKGVSDLHSHQNIDALASSVNDWPLEWRELFEERAGIMEFDGNLPRSDAERAAEAGVRKIFRLQQEAMTSQKMNVKGFVDE